MQKGIFPLFVALLFLIQPIVASEEAHQAEESFYVVSDNYYVNSFRKAKKYLPHIYQNHNKTFYCQCSFDVNKKIDETSCGYQVRKSVRRGQRLEWEHIVPAHRFGSARACWQQPASYPKCIKKNGKTVSGRKCCRRVDEQFREMEADMMNLVPSVGELNADRSNYAFFEIEGEVRKYGLCDFEVNSRQKIVEPSENLRGDIARTYFYFQTKYKMLLTDQENELFRQWHQADPIDEWEREKQSRVLNTLIRVGKTRQKLPSFVANE